MTIDDFMKIKKKEMKKELLDSQYNNSGGDDAGINSEPIIKLR